MQGRSTYWADSDRVGNSVVAARTSRARAVLAETSNLSSQVVRVAKRRRSTLCRARWSNHSAASPFLYLVLLRAPTSNLAAATYSSTAAPGQVRPAECIDGAAGLRQQIEPDGRLAGRMKVGSPVNAKALRRRHSHCK